MKTSQRPSEKKQKSGKKRQKSWVYFLQKKSKGTKGTSQSSKQRPEGQAEQDGSANTNMQHEKYQQKQNDKLLHQAETNDGAMVNTAITNIQSEKHVPSGKPRKVNVDAKLESLNHAKNSMSTVETDASKAKSRKKKEKRKLKIMQRKEEEKMRQAMINSSNTDSEGPKQHKSKEEDSSSRVMQSDKTGVPKKSKANTALGSSAAESISPCHGTSELKKRRNLKKGTKRKAKHNNERESRKCPKVEADVPDSGMSSGTETPLLPSQPQDVATNWKTLLTKLKSSAASKNKPHRRKRNLSNEKSTRKKSEIWFDDVDPALLEEENVAPDGKGGVEGGGGGGQGAEAVAEGTDVMSNEITKCVGLDCEMVGIGHLGKDSILARVSMVNQYGQCIYDKFVKPREKVTDYRTAVSGVRPVNLAKAEEFLTVQKEVAAIMKDRVLVGHALKNDMKVLFLGHPRRLIRDTATYPHFREIMKTKRPGLKKLAKTVLGVTIQEGEHSSVVDARTTMRLYTLHRVAWEKSLKQRVRKDKKGS